MDRRFFNMFPGLTEEKAIAILRTPFTELEDPSELYIAASHLINFPSEASINALIDTVRDRNPEQAHHIARRKAIESLGRLNAQNALPVIRECLQESDRYVVENAVWAIGEIGTDDDDIKEEIAQLLNKPEQSYRTIIQILAKFDYKAAFERIEEHIESEDEMIATASITASCRLSNDYSRMEKVIEFLQHSNVMVRRSCIQDLIDAKFYQAIPQIARCPVSVAFRLRGIRLLATEGITLGKLTFAEIESICDRVVRDYPGDLEFVHEYDQPPSLEFVIGELYHTDFGRCYLASQTLLDRYTEQAEKALRETYDREACNDYGAHYHVIKLWGWLQESSAYDTIVKDGLYNSEPQFMKSRAAAALALGNIGDKKAIPLLEENLKTPIFHLKYACLLALEQLGAKDRWQLVADDADLLIREKVKA
ncbi:MAG: HEAT repeat domain-containing protein [Cyanobacteria bacterium SBLK]|nr:HEAT repeat domain-containing protein [Cyanobacteria bacterium SBLK]